MKIERKCYQPRSELFFFCQNWCRRTLLNDVNLHSKNTEFIYSDLNTSLDFHWRSIILFRFVRFALNYRIKTHVRYSEWPLRIVPEDFYRLGRFVFPFCTYMKMKIHFDISRVCICYPVSCCVKISSEDTSSYVIRNLFLFGKMENLFSKFLLRSL